MQPGSFDSDLKALREGSNALRQQIDWTAAQHVRWWEERRALLNRVQELRRKLAALESEPSQCVQKEQCQELKAWLAEIDSASRWHASQSQVWQAEYRAAQERADACERRYDRFEREYARLENEMRPFWKLSSALKRVRRWLGRPERTDRQ